MTIALLSVSASALADTVFSDNFETAFAGWTISGTPDWYTGTPKSGTHSIQFKGTESMERVISTSGYSGITVSFSLAAYSLDKTTEVMRARCHDGTGWITLKQIKGGDPENDGILRAYTYALPASADNNPNLRLRFDLSANNHNNDYGYVDDVLVTGTLTSYTLSLTGSGSGSIRVNGTLQSLPWSGSFATGSSVTLEAVPQSGWEFASWSGDASGSANPVTVTMDGAKSVTANFNQLQYTLSLTGAGSGVVKVNGTIQSLPWSGQFLSNSTVTLEAVPQSGWEFGNWSGDASGSANPVTVTMDGAKSVAVTFSRIVYTLGLAKTGSGSVKVNGTSQALPWSGQFNSGEQVTLEAAAADGWRFDGWSGDMTWPGSLLIVTMDAGKSIVADFSQLSYPLSIIKTGSGSVKVNGTLHSLPWSDVFLSGTQVTLEAVPASGWRFDGWSGNATWQDKTLTVTMSGPKNLTATFSEDTFTLSLAKVGEGSVKVKGTLWSLPWSGQFTTGSQVTLEAVPDDGWEFKRWSGDANWQGVTLTVTMSENKTITAEFIEAKTFTISITAVGSGSVKLNGVPLSLPWSSELARDSQVTLQAVPATGWQFDGWAHDLTGTENPTVLTVNHTLQIEADFSQIQCRLSLAAQGAGTITVNSETRDLPSTETFVYGSEVTLRAIADSGWLFTGWSGDVAGSTNPLAIEITHDLTVTATFIQPASFTLSLAKAGSGSVKVDGAAVDLPWSGEFISGAEVTLEAVSGEDGQFAGWSGDITSETNPITIVMDGARNITANFACTTGPFKDVPCDYWAATAIEAVKDAGIAKGYSDGYYRPSLAVGRAAMAIYLARAVTGGNEQIPAGPAQPTFTDVPADHWAYDAIEYVYSNNIAAGYGDGTYQPQWKITRGQMAAFIARAIAEPMGEQGLAAYAPPSKPTFSDVSTTMWCYRHVEYLAGKGIAAGYPDGLYRPTATVTRDQMAVYMARAFDLLD